MSTKVLLTGAAGQLGQALQALVPPDVQLLAAGSAELDITRPEAVRAVTDRFRPDLIINCAAYTQVDKAESERERAFAVNAQGVENLAQAAPGKTRIIHVSTDFVFDGKKRSPYLPEDAPHPLSVYGQSKLAGEGVLRERKAQSSLILRTAWLYSPKAPNFVRTMLRLMGERESLSIVADQKGTPTSAASLARVIWLFAGRPDATGVFHWTDQGEATWHEFAREIQARALRLGLLKQRIPLRAIATADYPTPARRPAYSVLDKSRTYAAVAFEGLPWQEELEDVLCRIKNL